MDSRAILQQSANRIFIAASNGLAHNVASLYSGQQIKAATTGGDFYAEKIFHITRGKTAGYF